MTSEDITRALRTLHSKPKLREQWAFFAELRVGTGYGKFAAQSIDAYALNAWPSKEFHAIAYEIKVSRGDFFREIANPAKRYPGMMVSNEFYFATPSNLLSVGEIPELCGLVEVDSEGEISVVKKAEYRPKLNPDWRFLASLARRVCREEED